MSASLTSLIPGVGPHYAHVATFAIASTLAVSLGLLAKSSLGEGEASILPASRFSLRGIFELFTEFIHNLTETVVGHHGIHYVPLFTSIFFFVLINNLIGVIPGMTPATENLNTTLGMGVIIFLFYNYQGLKENGLAYLKHFMGPLLWLAPLMFVIELISHLVRPVSLGLRLANVMRGDHTVLGIFLDLVPILLPIPFYILGIFVCFVQAFVFTLLSMVYVSLATAHDH